MSAKYEEHAPREIGVAIEHPAWLEYDREVCIELWHNTHQTSSMRINRAEAESLRDSLTSLLETRP